MNGRLKEDIDMEVEEKSGIKAVQMDKIDGLFGIRRINEKLNIVWFEEGI